MDKNQLHDSMGQSIVSFIKTKYFLGKMTINCE